jgi:hypothetical protein
MVHSPLRAGFFPHTFVVAVERSELDNGFE